MLNPSRSGTAEVKRVGKFGIVGILNTGIDFALFNVIGHFANLTPVLANLISTTCAMGFSFAANKTMVFARKEGSLIKQAAVFYIVTAFGLYVLQTGTIHILTHVWTGPVNTVVTLSHTLGLSHYLTDRFIANNSAKAAGTILSLTWNYLTYKRIVFN
jgi:putative flippase GtrA